MFNSINLYLSRVCEYLGALSNGATFTLSIARAIPAFLPIRSSSAPEGFLTIWAACPYRRTFISGIRTGACSLETRSHSIQSRQSNSNSLSSSQNGFALIFILALIPLLLTAAMAIAGVTYSLQRRLLGQSLCVSQMSQLQSDLAIQLKELIKLNPKATRLQSDRAKAEKALRAAMASQIPQAIAAAHAYRAAVIAQQIALRTQQEKILIESRRLRIRYVQNARQELKKVQASEVRSLSQAPLGLAVAPKPVTSLSPSYDLINSFSVWQSQTLRFSYNPWPKFLFWATPKSRHSIHCQVSLKEREPWDLQIRAVSVSSNSRYY